jgi:hypothetical protein
MDQPPFSPKKNHGVPNLLDTVSLRGINFFCDILFSLRLRSQISDCRYKKSHGVAFLSGSIDLRGFLLELFIPFPLIFGGESYVMGLVQN